VTSPPLSGAPFPLIDAPEQILGRRCDDWTLVIDGTLPPQGLQLEVLQRISEGTDAVVIYNDVAKLNHELVHAHDGEIITAVTTSVPPHWDGTQPDRLRELAEEIGLGRDADTDFTQLQVLLVLAESVFGISLDEAGLEGSWYAAQVPDRAKDQADHPPAADQARPPFAVMSRPSSRTSAPSAPTSIR
jgi:hypothetical protein